MAQSTEYAPSTSTSKSKSRWKELGMSASSGADSLATMLRSGRRKSVDSLRSLRSNASRKSKTSKGDGLKVPPMPTIEPKDKALPPSPSTPIVGSEKQTGNVAEQTVESQEKSDAVNDLPSPSTEQAQPIITVDSMPIPEEAESAVIAPSVTALAEHKTADAEASKSIPKSTTATSIGKSSLVAVDENRSSMDAMTPRRNSLNRLRKANGSTTSHTPFTASNSSTSKLATSETAANLNNGTQWASEKNGGGDGNTIAQLYAVFGLPKDPAVWTLAEEDCVAGVHHAEGAVGRFWRPEVLGCSICPSPSDVLSKKEPTEKESGASKWSGRDAGGKKPSNPKFIEMADGRGGVEKAETARVLSKALKLSFTREIEIIAEQGNYPPSASSHTFSFSVPTMSGSGDTAHGPSFDGRRVAGAMGVSVGKASAANGVGEGYGLEHRAKVQGQGTAEYDDGPSLATFYGVVLTVWSAADDKRAKTIKRELTRAAKQRGSSAAPKPTKRSASLAAGSEWAEGDAGNAEEEEDRVGSPSLRNFATSNTFFMPYAICIVSRYPLYNLLGDWNKMAWHKYSRNIEMHNQLMSTILRHPAPRLGEKFSVGSPDKDLSFHCTFPGALEWGTGLIGIDMTMWPLFKTLSLDNIITICEVALAHNGRVLFQSRHPALLGLAVETIRYLVELCGWRGVANQNCHARDVKIYLEDPGSWIIGINTELRSIIKPAKEVCLVDLDINFVNCTKPPLGAITSRQNREKKKRRLLQAVATLANVEAGPPREIIEAYPGGRFRPLSNMLTRDVNSAYEQLATPLWWNHVSVVQAFDKVLRQGSKPTFLKKVLKARNNKVNDISESELAAILALRKRASTFVDARDGLENKIGRLNKRLAFLMSESDMWRAQFGKIQSLVDRLTKEANDLRSKVDKERRESRRLSSSLAQRDIEQVQLRLQLKDTETAREEAQAELLKMQRAMESLETERESMMDEIRAVISGSGGVEDVNQSLSRLDFPLPSYNPLVRSDSPTGSQVSMTASQSADYIMKSRAMAEARINEGRPGRIMSREASINGHVRSLSQDRGERQRKNPGMSAAQSTTSHVNHFPDEQMNYEIQQRTSIVTTQISRIQAQLESTLTQLEGRRSGTYEREMERRRLRRTSNSSLSSRYEYRAPSSLGHGGIGGPASSMGHGSEDGRSEMYDYGPMENIKGGDGDRSMRRRNNLSASQSVNSSLDANGVNSSLRPAESPTTTLSNGFSLQPSASPTSPLFQVGNGFPSPTAIGPKSPARQRDASNPWKEVTADKKLPSSTDSTPSKSLAYNSEIMLASRSRDTEPVPAVVEVEDVSPHDSPVSPETTEKTD